MIFNYKYSGNSSVQSGSKSTEMSFAPDTLRTPTFFRGTLHQNLPFREAISALHHVVVSDLRFKPKDREAYKAWAAEQEQIYLEQMSVEAGAAEVKAKMLRAELDSLNREAVNIMGPYNKARLEFYKYIYKKNYNLWFVLDPVITIHPDEIFFECFSQDESTYARLGCDYGVFKNIEEFECGTTNIDYSDALYKEFQKIRNYKMTNFVVDPSGFEAKTDFEDNFKELKIDLPDSWVRGFLQVSSAMTLDAVSFDLHPMDIYNFCLILKRYKEKTGPRSIRFQLKPGE
ncbi:MAG: SWIM zinc finger family protein, partial [Bacteroidota bacterium]